MTVIDQRDTTPASESAAAIALPREVIPGLQRNSATCCVCKASDDPSHSFGRSAHDHPVRDGFDGRRIWKNSRMASHVEHCFRMDGSKISLPPSKPITIAGNDSPGRGAGRARGRWEEWNHAERRHGNDGVGFATAVRQKFHGLLEEFKDRPDVRGFLRGGSGEDSSASTRIESAAQKDAARFSSKPPTAREKWQDKAARAPLAARKRINAFASARIQ